MYLYFIASTISILIVFTDGDGFSMVIDFTLLIIPEGVHVCVEQHHDERVEQVEQQPGVHHLHVGGLGQAVTHIDEHRCKDQHRGQVHCDDGLKGMYHK